MTAADLPDPAAGPTGEDPDGPGFGAETGASEGTPAPPAELVVAARFDVGGGYAVHRARGAPSWLFAWTLDGGGRFRQGGVTVRAEPGDLVALGPELAHDYAVAPGAPGWSFWWVHCPVRPGWHGWLAPHQVGERLYHVAGVPEFVRGRVESAFRRLHADARWSGEGPPPDPVSSRRRDVVPAAATGVAARELALGGVEEVLVLTTAAVAAAGPGPAAGPRSAENADPRVRRVEALLVADPAAPHTVASLAARVALSPSRLAHLFSAQTGRTPMRALRDARMRHAARLLEATDLPVGSVAAASGFVSAFHFSRVFRERFGVPPGDYRQTSRQTSRQNSRQNSRAVGSSSPRSTS
ncbi:AraC family transcriptional regulator [Actinopolymorpha cephalotaxi]|uniref:AraC family transcriptional regulator of arabinose operon n=1 Tax=Actinopolymorpha cephalotaxi TaxID=504797 RepID=A0ABX2S0J2_9ACTN|nr:AraC family transcriptional regulator [Actinopolymorpha cephalotaxi]NYH81947.1 AraC family transcriptional regulator of arabinose operon [Actinopolymorpha cephalotaxi]